MIYYLAASILILSLPSAISAIKCWDCMPEFNLTVSDAINTTNSNCQEKEKTADTCASILSIDLKYKNGTAILTHLPDQSLTFSNAKKTINIATTIWLSKDYLSAVVNLMNIDDKALEEDTNAISSTINTWKIDELRTELLKHLYFPLQAVSNLTCSNNKGETVSCGNGFCQLSATGTRIIDQKCIPQNGGTNPYGILVGSANVDGSDTDETMIYSCNTAMCNGLETAQKVHNLLHVYNLTTTNQFVTSPPPTTSTTTKPPKNKAHPMIDTAAWTIFLILSSFLTIVSM